MTPVDVEIRVTSGSTTVRGWDVGIPGLAVVENVVSDSAYRSWGVTHIASGCTFANHGYKSPEGAVALAHAIADAFDWTRFDDEMFNGSVVAAVQAALLAYKPDAGVCGLTVGREALKGWRP